MNYFVHKTAIVDDGAIIGPGSKIWHWTHISGGAKIGPKSSLGQNVFVGNEVSIGEGCKIQNNVSVYDNVILDDFVFCGPSAVFTNVINPRAEINKKSEFLSTHVHRGATIGANATIVCGNIIGEYAFIGAGAVVTKDVKPFALVLGNPGKQYGWVAKDGLRLNLPNYSKHQIEKIHGHSRYILKEEKILCEAL